MRHRLAWLVGLLGVLSLMAPAGVLADHCGADATITPPSGPAGATLVFETNLGAPSDLRLYRNGRLIRTVFLTSSDFVRYEILTKAGDAGAWRARAEVRGKPACFAEATFNVLGTPDTSTVPLQPGPPPIAAALAAIGTVAIGLRIRRRYG
jgi:hypothetical protein